MRRILKRILTPILKPAALRYQSKPRTYRSRGLTLRIAPSVFHPGLFLSTAILADFLATLDVKGKSFLELGAGSGFISLLAARNGARVTASDINEIALKSLTENAAENKLALETRHSDLFDALQADAFDVIFINPPYYPQDPHSMQEAAFYCGSDFRYFRKLFAQLEEQLTRTDSLICMILSEDCRLDTIAHIAREYGFRMELELETKKLQERNYIFRIRREPSH